MRHRGVVGQVFRQDDTFIEEPAEKLYNEGLFLMNDKHDMKAASKKFEEVDRQHPYSDWARKSTLMSAYAFYNGRRLRQLHRCRDTLRHLASGSPTAVMRQYLIAASHYDQIRILARSGRTRRRLRA